MEAELRAARTILCGMQFIISVIASKLHPPCWHLIHQCPKLLYRAADP